MSERQEAHDRIRARQYEEERPKPLHELDALQRLARKAVADPSAALAFAVAMTPENYVDALDAEAWDKAHPWYSCIHCHDGADLPEGYVCKECGADNPRPGTW